MKNYYHGKVTQQKDVRTSYNFVNERNVWQGDITCRVKSLVLILVQPRTNVRWDGVNTKTLRVGGWLNFEQTFRRPEAVYQVKTFGDCNYKRSNPLSTLFPKCSLAGRANLQIIVNCDLLRRGPAPSSVIRQKLTATATELRN